MPFSPIDDAALPEGLDGLYLGGGYPELSAAGLAANTAMRSQIRESSRRGMPIYSECGGFMYLCREIVDTGGRSFPMAGCFPFRTRMHPRLAALGYREVTLTRDGVVGAAGDRLRGHEFHYSSVDPQSDPGGMPTVFAVTARAGGRQQPTGYATRRTLGSYIHLHFGSRPAAADSFVADCLAYRQEREDAHEAT